MLVGVSLIIIVMLVIFSLILEGTPVGIITEIGIDNTAIVDGVPSTYLIEAQDIVFTIDSSSLIVSALLILATIILVATATGFQVLGSGMNPQSVRVFVLITGFLGLWTALTILVFNLIISIEVFGSIIYITLTIAYVIGVVQKLSD